MKNLKNCWEGGAPSVDALGVSMFLPKVTSPLGQSWIHHWTGDWSSCIKCNNKKQEAHLSKRRCDCCVDQFWPNI